MKRVTCLLLAALLCLSFGSCSSAKTVEFGYFDGNFSPFFTRNFQDMSVMALTQESLMITGGDDQAEPIFDAYTQGLGIADLDMQFEDDVTVCTVKIGEDVFFSDGMPVTATDVAFSMYVYAQEDYDGWSSLNACALDGLTAYRYGTNAAEQLDITNEQIEAELAAPSERTKELIRTRIVLPVLREGYTWVTHLYGDSLYNGTVVENHIKDYPDSRDLFAFYYALDKNYKAHEAGDAEQVITDIADQYGADYSTLGNVYGNPLDNLAYRCAKQAITERMLEETEPGEKVTSIRGIKIVDEKTLVVTLNSVAESQIEAVFGIYVAPFHYYGEGCTFDGSGFVIDLDAVAEKSGAPLGAGRYVFKGYKPGGGVSFTKNNKYFRDIELEPSLKFTETGNSGSYSGNGYFTTVENRMYAAGQKNA